jgi:mannose-1-phosphate guanylyltransferase/mannose-6-phosphate isomerase
MLQEAAKLAHGTLPNGWAFRPSVVMCNYEHRFLIAAQLQAAGISGARIVLEPVERNSAAALASAAALLAEEDPDAILWIISSDAMVDGISKLHDLLPAAAAAARQGHIVTFGVTPTAPYTGYGYIEVGRPIDHLPGVHEAARFKDEPSAAEAAEMAGSGSQLWNSGMFVATATTLLAELARHEPNIAARATAAVHRRQQDLDFIRLDPDSFAACPECSFGFTVSQLTTHEAVVVVPVDLRLSDVGSWNALWHVSDKDPRGNVAVGDTMLENADDCYVRSDGILTAVVGLKDAVVVVTRDAVLAMHRDHAENVTDVVQRLRAYGRKEVVSHNLTYRPWGFYESLILQPRFQVKRIVVDPGHKLSLQKHFHRAEHWIVVHGSALVTRDAEQVLVGENESIYLPLGCIHRLENPGRIPLTLIEVQVGPYLGEDDIVRIEDVYARS